MWHTSQGTRTLQGHEADLVLESVGHLRDMVAVGFELDEPFQSEVGLFNSLQSTQQLALLHEVAFGLLDPDFPALETTAVREATIHVIFRELLSLIEIEIDLGREPFLDANEPDLLIRAAIVMSCEQINLDFSSLDNANKDMIPDVDCEEIDRWEMAIEFLSDQILWDRDFEFDPLLSDTSPEQTEPLKNHLGISKDYFSTPAPDVSDSRYQQLDIELVQLTGTMRPLFENSDEWLPEDLNEPENLNEPDL